MRLRVAKYKLELGGSALLVTIVGADACISSSCWQPHRLEFGHAAGADAGGEGSAEKVNRLWNGGRAALIYNESGWGSSLPNGQMHGNMASFQLNRLKSCNISSLIPLIAQFLGQRRKDASRQVFVCRATG